MVSFNFDSYLSPFTWRYGSSQMRSIWSEKNKRLLWRRIWVELAKEQHTFGVVTEAEIKDLIAHQNDVDIEKANAIEAEIHHDLMSEIKVFASQAKIGGGKIHLGATSMDIEDNADAIRQKQSLELVENKVKELLKEFSVKIEQYKSTVCMGYTHLQPAEPTTLGYRFCFYAQDLLLDLELLKFVLREQKSKGLKGTVGTSASYVFLLDERKAIELEKQVMKSLGINAITISSQTNTRKLEFFVSSVLSSIAQSLYKFAFDIRILQSPGFGELSEPFGKKQVGSSAMPFKRNPIQSEQICSLARLIMQLSDVSKDNAAHLLLERTLDDSANRRIYIPEMFLASDSILDSAIKIVQGLVVNEKQIAKNVKTHGPFAATEVIMMQAVKNGADRQELHEAIRQNSMRAYEHIQDFGENNLEKLLMQDERITNFVDKKNIAKLLNPTTHIGLAPQKCEQFLQTLKNIL